MTEYYALRIKISIRLAVIALFATSTMAVESTGEQEKKIKVYMNDYNCTRSADQHIHSLTPQQVQAIERIIDEKRDSFIKMYFKTNRPEHYQKIIEIILPRLYFFFIQQSFLYTLGLLRNPVAQSVCHLVLPMIQAINDPRAIINVKNVCDGCFDICWNIVLFDIHNNIYPFSFYFYKLFHEKEDIEAGICESKLNAYAVEEVLNSKKS